MKKIFLLLLSLFLLAGCKDVKLTNGKNALVTFKEGGISSDELYQELKETYGAEKLMNLIDMHLLEKLYETDNDEKAYVNQTVKTTKKTAKDMNADFDLYLQYYYGIKSESEFRDYLSLNYKRDLWTQDYAEEEVTEKQIQQYYEKEVGKILLHKLLKKFYGKKFSYYSTLILPSCGMITTLLRESDIKE